tara:strand:+ start:672 stop:818 length:147 start_codon:yes stop_codon:yes gene_type:complete
MKNYRFTYYGVAISKKNFLQSVPENWESDLNEFGCFSYGGYDATLIED